MKTLVATPDPPLVREAFAHGYALSGGPLTDTVKAAYLVACQHPDRLHEAVDLGHMSGTWALIAARREQVYADQLTAIVKAWRTLVRGADLRAAVKRVRDNLGLGETTDPEKDRRKAEAAAAAAVALLLLGNRNNPHWTKFVDALAAGMTVAQAEGVAGAVGIAASQAGHTGVDLQAVYDETLAAQTEVQKADTAARAELAATQILRGATTDLGRALTSADTMSAMQMLDSAQNALGIGEDQPADGGNTSVGLYGDQTLGHAFLAAALNWYLMHGVQRVNFIAQADACIICQNLAAGSPYRISDVPDPPIHPRCRCVTENADPVLGFDWTQFLR